MRRFRADLHIHTVLSACADLGMSPTTIVRVARDKNIDLIGITDHNTTLHCGLIKEIAEEQGIAVLCGAEVTSREEVHCLAYFEDLNALGSFQEYLDANLPFLPYQPEKLGYQALVDKDEKIIKLIDGYMNIAINQNIDSIEQEVHRLGGLFVPAHVERQMFGIFSQLGFLPDHFICDAMGIMGRSLEKDIRSRFGIPERLALIKASDAHSPEEIGCGTTWFEMKELTFQEIKRAILGIDGRKTIIE